jgi:hypothetical protein
MAKVQAGLHSVRELLDAAGFDFEKEAAADYNDGAPDFRRVKVGGLSFDDLEKSVNVPPTADSVEITLDGKKVASLDVELDERQKEERRLSFESAAEADDPSSE